MTKIVEAKVEHNAIYWISVILTLLFAWIVFPIKWCKIWRHNAKKRRAMRKARRKSKKVAGTIYVVQWGNTFFYGSRAELRLIVDKRGRKAVKSYTGHHVFDVDFRNAVVAKYCNGVPA